MTQEIAFKDYYAALNLSLGATSAEVEDAYRGLTRGHAASSSDSSKRTLAELSEAYKVLASPAFRREYDQLWISVHGNPAAQAATLDGDEFTSAPPPLAVMAKQHTRPRAERRRTQAKRWLEGRRMLLVVALIGAFWIIVGAALAVTLL